jgi:hypothetical protein
LDVEIARQITRLIESFTSRTDPSDMAAFTPPECLLQVDPGLTRTNAERS